MVDQNRLPNAGVRLSFVLTCLNLFQEWGRGIYFPLVLIIGIWMALLSETVLVGIGTPRATTQYYAWGSVISGGAFMVAIVSAVRFRRRVGRLVGILRGPHYIYYIGNRDSYLVVPSSVQSGVWVPHIAFRNISRSVPQGLPAHNYASVDAIPGAQG